MITIIIFFGYTRHFSVMQLLLELGSSSWNTLIINSQSVSVKSWQNSENRLFSHVHAHTRRIIVHFLFLRVYVYFAGEGGGEVL